MDRPKKKCFWLEYATPHGRKEERILIQGELDLGYYLKERKLIALFKKSRTVRSEDRVPVRLSYVPRSGDVIEFEDGGREQ